jgi:hypothetical protein
MTRKLTILMTLGHAPLQLVSAQNAPLQVCLAGLALSKLMISTTPALTLTLHGYVLKLVPAHILQEGITLEIITVSTPETLELTLITLLQSVPRTLLVVTPAQSSLLLVPQRIQDRLAA